MKHGFVNRICRLVWKDTGAQENDESRIVQFAVLEDVILHLQVQSPHFNRLSLIFKETSYSCRTMNNVTWTNSLEKCISRNVIAKISISRCSAMQGRFR